MGCKGKPKPPVSESQRRWAFAAEDRGQLPSGTAMKWSRRAEGKDLPMEKKGMFFENHLHPEDGMFMKCAQPLGSFINASQKPAKQEVPSTGVPQTAPPTQQDAATATQDASMGCGGKLHKQAADDPLGKLKTQTGRTLATMGKSTGDIATAAGSKIRSGAEAIGGSLKNIGQSGLQYASKAPEHITKGLKYVEGLPPWAHAGIVGAGGVYTYAKAKNMIKRMAAARGVAAPAEGVIMRALKKAGTLMRAAKGKL